MKRHSVWILVPEQDNQHVLVLQIHLHLDSDCIRGALVVCTRERAFCGCESRIHFSQITMQTVYTEQNVYEGWVSRAQDSDSRSWCFRCRIKFFFACETNQDLKFLTRPLHQILDPSPGSINACNSCTLLELQHDISFYQLCVYRCVLPENANKFVKTQVQRNLCCS